MGVRFRVRAAAAAVGALAFVAGCTTVVDGAGDPGTPLPSESSSGPISSSPSAPTPFPVNFLDCGGLHPDQLGLSLERLEKLTFECGSVAVPLDYAEPDGEDIGIFLLRVHDSDNTASTGSLLVNPGGPGGSGALLALSLASQLPEVVLEHFDIVGFDPRGVGNSSPVDCLDDTQQDVYNAESPNVLTPGGFAQAKSIAQDYAHACKADYGADLADYNTVQSARDMDQIRQALGDDKLNYLGFSYGTELGAQYLHLFPQNVRVAVLDGAVDPLYGPIESSEKQLQGFEDAFDQFGAWCREHEPCIDVGDPRQAVYDIVAATRRLPLPVAGDSRTLTASLALTGVSEALYSRPQWPVLGRALFAAQNGAGKGLMDLADRYYQRYHGTYTNLMDAFNTISCNDSPPGPSDATIHATAQRWATKYPMFGLHFAAGLFTCQQWQPDRTVLPLPTAPDSAEPILVIGNLHDPATPYQGAVDLTKTLGNARLLSWNGQGHTSYLQGSACVDDYVNAYLVDGTLPPENTTCPP